MKKLNLGCGLKYFKGYDNLDYYKHEGVDIVYDLNKIPWKFAKDNIYDEIYSDNTLEHLKPDIIDIMNEIYKIAKPNSTIKIIVPHYTTGGTYSEHHYKFFWYRSFEYRFGKGSFSLENTEWKKFKMIKRKLIFNKIFPWNWIVEPIVNFWIMPYIYENTFLQYLFPAQDIYFEMKVIKTNLK